MTTQIKNLTKAAIENMVAKNTDGPVTLWHFKSPDNPRHTRNLVTLHTMFPGLTPETLEIGGLSWKLQARDGCAALVRAGSEESGSGHKPGSTKKDFYQFWLVELRKKGLIKERGGAGDNTKTGKRPKSQTQEFGYDFSAEEEDGDVL